MIISACTGFSDHYTYRPAAGELGMRSKLSGARHGELLTVSILDIPLPN